MTVLSPVEQIAEISAGTSNGTSNSASAENRAGNVASAQNRSGNAASADTIAINQATDQFIGRDSVWLFGYGSLIYKADFPYLERRPASITGWTRRFWQGSHDHRGTPDAPGRVVTIIADADSVCHGMAYLVTPQVFGPLDHREKNGYLRLGIDIAFDNGAAAVHGLVYIATDDNAAFLGPASEPEIAAQIARSAGPSGPNSDYLNHLATALRDMGRDDPHVFAIERHLAQLSEAGR